VVANVVGKLSQLLCQCLGVGFDSHLQGVRFGIQRRSFDLGGRLAPGQCEQERGTLLHACDLGVEGEHDRHGRSSSRRLDR
jgi:hypothetical protein